ncbi:MAG: cytochrome c biogenesis protein [Armatimonadetes bacterium]|nr:cytochrome c biogenesis protein [Armatimonadota bacterium]
MSLSACFYGIAFFFYFLSGVLYLGGLFVRTPHWTPPARLLARAALVTHTLAMAIYGFAVHHAPFVDPWESLSFFAWSLTLLFLIIDWRRPLPALGAFVIPLAFLALFFASARATPGVTQVPFVQSHAIKIHIAVSLMGYGSFALAFCTALIYLLQERRLKQKRIHGLFQKFLPLEQADRLANRLVGIGFALLTLGLLMGLNFAARDWSGRWWLDPKILSSFVTWLLYGAYLYVHSVAGWRGHRTMLLLVAGFATVLIGYLGINLSGVGRHAYPF